MMLKELLKDKRKIGIFIVLIITIVVVGIIYLNSGFKELKKNDTESIFVDENSDASDNGSSKNSDSKNKGSKSNLKENKDTVVSKTDKNIVVEIKGEVKKPDVYILNENAIIKDLIEAAGGLTDNADLTNINRAKKLQNHDLVYIANKNEAIKGSQGTEASSSSKDTGNSDKKININTANLEELKTINGVGDAKAKSIIEYREKNGNFQSIEDIKNVTGITEKMFEKIKEQIEV